MASIQKRVTKDGEVRYRVQVRLRGHPVQRATFRTKTEAKQWVQDTESAIRNGRYFHTVEAKRHTLAELIDRYIETVAPRRPRSADHTSALLRFWKEVLGEYTLADVTPALIGEVRDKLSAGTTQRGGKRAPATVNRYVGALSHAFTIAVKEWGWVDQNPVFKVQRLPEPRGRVRFLQDHERGPFLEACREISPRRLYPLVVVALCTGARQGELLNLRWPDVDLERGVAVFHQTKNNERRAVPLTGPALEVLREASRIRRVDTDLVFPSETGLPKFPQRQWEEALRAAQIDDFRFHDLRHSAASYLAMSGATLAEIAEVLGHKTLAMVKRYSHLTEQHTSKVVARMTAKFFGS